MTISVNWATKVITVPKADLTLVGGNLYELDTNALRVALKSLEDDVEGMPFPDTHRHNSEVTVAGTTFARVIEIINGYSVEFENGSYTVVLLGSNNNIFDAENGILMQNTVQIIAQNSAGLIVSAEDMAPTPQEIADAVWDEALAGHVAAGSAGLSLADAQAAAEAGAVPGSAMTLETGERDAITATLLGYGIEPSATLLQALRLILASQAGKLSGAAGTTIRIRDIDDTKDRIVATVDVDGNRTAVVVDGA